jgi:hypothetical protein
MALYLHVSQTDYQFSRKHTREEDGVESLGPPQRAEHGESGPKTGLGGASRAILSVSLDSSNGVVLTERGDTGTTQELQRLSADIRRASRACRPAASLGRSGNRFRPRRPLERGRSATRGHSIRDGSETDATADTLWVSSPSVGATAASGGIKQAPSKNSPVSVAS